MKPLSIRASVTVWYLASTALMLVAFSSLLYFGIRASLFDGLDAELRARADGLVAMCEWEGDRDRVEIEQPASFRERIAREQPSRTAELWTWPEMAMLYRVGPTIPMELPAAPTADVSVRATLGDGDVGTRVCTILRRIPAVAATSDEPAKPAFEVLVRVADSTAALSVQLSRIGAIVLALAALSLVAALAFGLFLSRRFVRPLARLGEAAAAVRSGARATIPRRATGDEIDRLAAILDVSFGELQEALERQARFTSDAAHELRNPIAVIHNAAEVARRGERTAAETDAFLEDILLTAQRMASIVESLLLLARMDVSSARSAFKDVDLSALAHEAADAHPPRARARIRVDDGGSRIVRGDADLLRVLIDNLLSNALRYSGDDSAVELALFGDGEATTISVIDHGPGLPAEQANRVFERFYRGSNADFDRGGVGLGLSIVAAVARLHEASCEIASDETGTRMTVRLSC